MRLSDFQDIAQDGVMTFGDITFRGKCATEDQEQITFFSRVRRIYPNTWGRIALHPRNEGLRIGRQLASVARHKAEGMTPGAADIIIPARISFVCELKRRDPTLGKWQDGQREYLAASAKYGAFACVALGCDAAWQAFEAWLASSDLA